MAYQIVPATEATMAEIETWLDAEEAVYQTAHKAWEAGGYDDDIPVPPRGFRCNWDSVKRSWREGRVRVDILVVDDQAVGFLDGTDILEIRPDLRRAGYGRVLADFMVKLAYDEGRSVVEIEIAPPTAEPFWKRMGFTSVPDRQGSGGGIYAYKILPRTFRLAEGERVPFSVAFYSEEERHKDDPKPLAQFSGLGERLSDGTVQLPERASCFHPTDNGHGDYFVRIEIEGRLLHFDKAKREMSKRYGVECDKGFTYFLDRISPEHSPA